MSLDGIIMSDVQPGTSTADIDLVVMRRNLDETDGPRTQEQEEKAEKSRFFLPKCLLLAVILMMMIAGIVALIVRFKSDDHAGRGQVLPDKITYVECPSKSFSLGEKLNFTCIFDLTHEYRKILKNATKALIRPKNRALQDGINTYSEYKLVPRPNGTNNYTFVFDFNGQNATCSSAGSYDVIFQNENGTDLHTATVDITIKTSSLTTEFKQRKVDGHNCTSTVFDATCKLSNDCNNYHTTFFRDKNGRELSMNQYMSCERNYSDAAGYTVTCTAELPDSLVENYVLLGCKMETRLQHNNRNFQLRKEFSLPGCEIQERCHTYIPMYPYTRAFNCSEKSRDVVRLNEATCDFQVLKNCFMPGRQIFIYHKNRDNDLACPTNYTIPVCRLSWCRNYSFIIKREIPGVAICRNQYEEPNVPAYTTEGPV